MTDIQPWTEVLDFWFPEGQDLTIDVDTHRSHWFWRMRGGADKQVVSRFSRLAAHAAEGRLAHWANTPEGRLALIIVLDQFSRSVWRGTARAYAQDVMALSLTQEGLENGQYETLSQPWLKVVFGLPLGHCEGDDHLGRLDLLVGLRRAIHAKSPAHLQPIYQSLITQAQDVRRVVAEFGRHPHRNQVLGRASTQAELAYIKSGSFPNLRAFSQPTNGKG